MNAWLPQASYQSQLQHCTTVTRQFSQLLPPVLVDALKTLEKKTEIPAIYYQQARNVNEKFTKSNQNVIYIATFNFCVAKQSHTNFGSRLFELLPPVLACTSWLEMHRNTRKQARRNKRKIHKA